MIRMDKHLVGTDIFRLRQGLMDFF